MKPLRRLHAPLVVLVLGFWSTPAVSQRLASFPVAGAVEAPTVRPVAVSHYLLASVRDSTVYQSSYWKEGMIAGAITGALLAGLAGATFCGTSETEISNCGLRVLLAAGLAAPLGGGIGALIGGLFPKEATKPEEGT